MDYVAHFNTATLKVQDLNESVALLAMKKGLQSSIFTFFLDKKFSKTYLELLERMHKYALAEEGAISRC